MATETYDPNGLFAGDFDITTATVTIKSGQNLVRGTVLGRITASDKFIKSLSAATDGSETPCAILALDCDASSADTAAQAYFAGEFNGAALTYGTGHTAATVEKALRVEAAPMFIRTLA